MKTPIKKVILAIILTIAILTPTLANSHIYDVNGLVKILENSIEICKILGYDDVANHLEEESSRVGELLSSDNIEKAFSLTFSSSREVTNLVEKERVELPPEFEVRGELDRLEFYVSILNETGQDVDPIIKEIDEARSSLKKGDLDKARKHIKNGEKKLNLYIPERSFQGEPTTLFNLLLRKYNATIKYAIQVGVALNESEYAKLEEKIEKIKEIMKNAENLAEENRDIEALVLLQENLDTLTYLQEELNHYHREIIERLFRENSRLLILKLEIVAKQYKGGKLRELVDVASFDLDLAKEDLRLNRTEIAYLRVLRASKILDYVAREEGR